MRHVPMRSLLARIVSPRPPRRPVHQLQLLVRLALVPRLALAQSLVLRLAPAPTQVCTLHRPLLARLLLAVEALPVPVLVLSRHRPLPRLLLRP
jgi:hypothetical protein